MDIKTKTDGEMKKTVEALSHELAKIRTGRANVSMLDSIKVDYYGSATPLNQVAALSCPDARSFLVSPWEASILKEIEQSIVKSNLGMAPINDGKVIRLRLPELTEDRRKDLVKQCKKIVEDARVSLRSKRKDANDLLKNDLKDKVISEDDHKKQTDLIQKLTDDYNAKIDKISADKEKEIMTV